MNLVDLVVSLRRIGATVRRERGRLVLVKPFDAQVPEYQLQLLRENRDEVQAIIAGFTGGKRSVTAPARGVAGNRFPLSLPQTRWWQTQLRGVNLKSLIMQNVLRLDEPVDLDLVERVINLLIDRHEVFRTAYDEHQGAVWQIIHDSRPIRLLRRGIGEFTGLSEQNAVRQVFEELLEHQYDLRAGDVVRCCTLCVAENLHYLFVAIHHIAADGRSLHALLREFELAYLALSEGRDPARPTARARYVDYVEFERQIVARPELEQYWKRVVVPDHGYNEIPVRGAFKNPDLRSSRVELRIGEDLTAQIREVLAISKVSKSAFLLSVLAVSIYRFLARRRTGGIRGLNVGVPVAGHATEEWHGVIGCFANMTVLTIGLENLTQPFVTFARAVSARIAENIENRYLPFPRLMQVIDIEPDNRLFQISFNMITAPPTHKAERRLKIGNHPLTWRDRTCLFDLALNVDDQREVATLFFEYRVTQLEQETVRRIAGSFERALHACLRAVRAAPETQRTIDLIEASAADG